MKILKSKFNLPILTMLFALFVLQSCNEQQEIMTTVTEIEQASYPQVESYIEISPNDFKELSDFMDSEEYNKFMNDQSFSAVKFYKYTTDTNDSFFGIKIYNNNLDSNIELFVYPEKYEIPAMIIETNTTLEGEAISVAKVKGYTPIYSGIFGQNNLEDRKENCYETSATFTDCMVCAMGVITDDVLGTVACTFNSLACIAAAGIHCSGATSD